MYSVAYTRQRYAFYFYLPNFWCKKAPALFYLSVSFIDVSYI